MEIEKLLKLPESKTLEFKNDLFSIDPIIKTIVAFANTAGGTLIIGFTPKKELLGVEEIFNAEKKLANAIAESIHPQIFPEIDITTYNNKNILIVRVVHWKAPYYIKKIGFPNSVYIRLGSTNQLAGPELLAEMQRSALIPTFDEQPLSDLSADSLELEKARHMFWEVGKELNEKKLRSLGVLVPFADRIVPSIGGLILFGKPEVRKQLLPDARVGCIRFKGDEKTDVLERYEIEGTILEALDTVQKFIKRNTPQAAETGTNRRPDISEYPPIAVREILINALAHCDYSSSGSYIQVAIFNNRLEVQVPGTLPFGFTIEDFKSGISRVRNRVIARVFGELDLMKAWGSGYKRIHEICQAGEYLEPKWEELGTYLRVTFRPYSKTLLEVQEKSNTYRIDEDGEMLPRQRTVLNLFSVGGYLPFRQISAKLGDTVSPRTLRYDLVHLKELGYITSKGIGRAIVWVRIK